MDTHKRTIVKTITWRIIATVITIITVYLWTGSWQYALGSGVIANALKIVFYYMHERIWNKIDYGRIRGKA